MSPTRQPHPAPADERPIACLGEAIADLICERNLQPGEAPGPFVPHPGGALANVAVHVARCGSPAALVGGVGDDGWGRWLDSVLEAEGVSTEWLARLEGVDTPIALVEFDPRNEPAFQVYGEHIGPTMAAASGFLDEAVAGSQAVVVGSNTMVGEPEREITRRAVELAREAGIPLLLDPNHRPNRWTRGETARNYCLELTRAATVIKLNRGEAELITGLADPEAAARALVELGPELVVITDGEGTILTAGAAEATFRPEPVPTVSPLGAGDAFMGGLASGLARRDWDLSSAAEVLPEAAAAAAGVCGSWGAQ